MTSSSYLVASLNQSLQVNLQKSSCCYSYVTPCNLMDCNSKICSTLIIVIVSNLDQILHSQAFLNDVLFLRLLMEQSQKQNRYLDKVYHSYNCWILFKPQATLYKQLTSLGNRSKSLDFHCHDFSRKRNPSLYCT